MIYGKLPIVFLSTIASEKKDSTNSQIASYILDHLDDFQNIGIKEMAEECHVAPSSISRFVKDIGLKDFAELKELLLTTHLYFEEQSSLSNSKDRLHDYTKKVKESLEMVEASIDVKAISKLCDDIHHYQNVASFGL